MSDQLREEDIHVLQLGDRQILQIDNVGIPVDRILKIEYDGANGGCNNSVRFYLDGVEDWHEHPVWAYENADVIKAYLAKLRVSPRLLG